MYFQYYINHHLSQYEDQDKDKERTHLNVNTLPCWAPHRRSLENYFGIKNNLWRFSQDVPSTLGNLRMQMKKSAQKELQRCREKEAI